MDVYKELFLTDDNPLILCDIEGVNCILNSNAKDHFSIDRCSDINDIFPGIELVENELSITDSWGNNQNIIIKYLKESHQWYFSINNHLNDWELFVRDQKIMHQLYLDLCILKDEKEVYKKIVETGLSKLKFDRLGILLFSIEEDLLMGSWGTDDNGNVVDQSYFSSCLKDERWALNSLEMRDYVAIEYDIPLHNAGVHIGRGWNSVANIYDGDEPVGWIAFDNYFSKKALPGWKKEVMGELGRLTSRLISRIRQEGRLQHMVDERTRELKESQKHLVESEKLASLGSLVAGVSHELNTPIGVALTATSHAKDNLIILKKNIQAHKVTEKEFIKSVDSSLESLNIATLSINKASAHINNFKQLAGDQSHENKREIKLHDLINILITSLENNYNTIDFEVINSIDPQLKIYSSPGDFIQIYSQLFNNSIIHGFENIKHGIIEVGSRENNKSIILTIKDNGSGIKDKKTEQIFEPFYTTKRSEGIIGLGLNIIYNTVTNLGGKIEAKKTETGLLFILTFESSKLKKETHSKSGF